MNIGSINNIQNMKFGCWDKDTYLKICEEISKVCKERKIDPRQTKLYKALNWLDKNTYGAVLKVDEFQIYDKNGKFPYCPSTDAEDEYPLFANIMLLFKHITDNKREVNSDEKIGLASGNYRGSGDYFYRPYYSGGNDIYDSDGDYGDNDDDDDDDDDSYDGNFDEPWYLSNRQYSRNTEAERARKLYKNSRNGGTTFI